MRRSIHSTPYVVLREHLTAARIAAPLTQEELAAKLGRPQSYVAKYETGDRRLDVVEFLEVCTSIGIDPAIVIDAVQEAFSRG
jgi:transcriptional regulator with XRE-family HTH domain